MSKVVRATGLEHIELEHLRERVGRLFATLQEAADNLAPPPPGAWAPLCDLCESEDQITARVELPGVRAEEIDVMLTSTQLRISGEKRKQMSNTAGGISHLLSERSYGPFIRIVPLRWSIKTREATARLRQGILTVYLPKLTERRGLEFHIPIKEDDEIGESGAGIQETK